MTVIFPTIVTGAGSRMKPGNARGPVPKIAIIVPRIAVPFEEAVSRLLKVTPPKKKQ